MRHFQVQFDRVLVDAAITHPAAATRQVDPSKYDLAAARKMAQSDFETAKAQQQLNEIMKAIVGQLADLHTCRVALCEKILNRSYYFVQKIAEVVFQRCPELATARLQGYVQSALAELEEDSDITIYVHPSLLQPTREQIQLLPQASHITVVADPQLSQGDCRLEQGDEGLYASLNRQLEEIEAGVLSAVIEDSPACP